MGIASNYRLRLKRKRKLLRAWLKSRDLSPVVNRTNTIKQGHILLFSTIRDELVRLPYFLEYYRKLGVNHFFFVDNGSEDGSGEFLAEQTDVSLWRTDASYKGASYGVDWLNALKHRYAHDHWVLVVDVDEFLVYAFCDTRPLKALTQWLNECKRRSFGTMLIDMYSREGMTGVQYESGQNPIEFLPYFDSGNYSIELNPEMGNLWIQGGVRQRVLFNDRPFQAPALNKIPLVKWQRGNVYTSSTHSLLPRGLNQVFEPWGGEKASGCLLHAKFLDVFTEKVSDEMERGQHFANSREYKSYANHLENGGSMWTEASSRYQDWRQLESLGLMSAGNWV